MRNRQRPPAALPHQPSSISTWCPTVCIDIHSPPDLDLTSNTQFLIFSFHIQKEIPKSWASCPRLVVFFQVLPRVWELQVQLHSLRYLNPRMRRAPIQNLQNNIQFLSTLLSYCPAMFQQPHQARSEDTLRNHLESGDLQSPKMES